MKKKILKLVRILITTLMVLTVLAVSVLPAAAYPSSFDSSRLVPPFHLSLRGIALGSDGSGGLGVAQYVFQYPLPSIPYDFDGYEYSNAGSILYVNDFEVADVFVNSDEALETSHLYNSSVLTYSFTLQSNRSNLLGTFEFDLVGGFLSPDYSLLNANDGIAFALLDDSFLDPVIFPGSVNAEFFIGQYPYDDWSARIPVSDHGAYLSYYQVLYYSNFPFLDYLPRSYDKLDWSTRFEAASSIDFSAPSSADLSELDYLFSWIGPLYGTFGVFYTPSGSSDEWSFDVSYVLVDYDRFGQYYEIMLEDSAYSSYTGFEKVTHFLGSAVQGFFSVEILPDFSLGSILVVIIAFSLVLWWLKVFAGG